MKVRKCISVLLTVLLFVSCFSVTARAVTEATGRFTITVEAGKEERARTAFSMEAGEIVTINATYTPFSANVDFGLVDENGIFHYLSGKNGSFNESIEITVRGKYTFAIRNNSDKPIEATGYVNY